ncbi:UdgX family uracil-DNA binding protein [Acetobacter pasteurianus]|uniref:Type-4 uracil-DNA glycosylase n=1 Tax=Acetobacter pasteurianus subsp. pasteurianus TaxID=481145 RepID=A0A1Y0XZZ5_ACEPA|nr:UdgX family uracil-DNA binding protein [Acetobacter pasteurianus]ARW48519.1 DNA-directed DNA polymerase [Acetobacter pasteurianus subsp. pasteurianus]
MVEIVLAHQVDLATWRAAARHYVQKQVLPESISWRVAGKGEAPWKLEAPESADNDAPLNLPRKLVTAVLEALQAHYPERFALLYRVVYRFAHGLLDMEDLREDPDIQRLRELVQNVKQETEQFRLAFSAFSAQRQGKSLHYTPQNYIVEANGHFCVERNAQPWEVITPYRRMWWDGTQLHFAQGEAEAAHVSAEMWQKDGQGIWQGYPNTVLMPTLEDVAQAPSLASLSAEAMDCRACSLWQPANRTVFGEGAENTPLMFVGEQPGDQEDLAGRPFVGPAGQVFDRALEEAGILRDHVYVTNAVKHFRFTWRNNRRLHQKPDQESVDACRIWLDAERRLVHPKLIVMLGVTAAQSLLKRPVTISRERSRVFQLDEQCSGLVTVHPSYLLRLPNEEAKAREYARFIEDLRLAHSFITQQSD